MMPGAKRAVFGLFVRRGFFSLRNTASDNYAAVLILKVQWMPVLCFIPFADIALNLQWLKLYTIYNKRPLSGSFAKNCNTK